jgi:hypothetical protein
VGVAAGDAQLDGPVVHLAERVTGGDKVITISYIPLLHKEFLLSNAMRSGQHPLVRNQDPGTVENLFGSTQNCGQEGPVTRIRLFPANYPQSRLAALLPDLTAHEVRAGQLDDSVPFVGRTRGKLFHQHRVFALMVAPTGCIFDGDVRCVSASQIQATRVNRIVAEQGADGGR